ncbi:hypothetical protein ACH5RR_009979 [Cinchona calisaya]|uniref:Uncharacterized protein n=1 Tax=Cinchona calisaya TaxID=153742 RepID=A0ABD3AI73_9GENT
MREDRTKARDLIEDWGRNHPLESTSELNPVGVSCGVVEVGLSGIAVLVLDPLGRLGRILTADLAIDLKIFILIRPLGGGSVW